MKQVWYLFVAYTLKPESNRLKDYLQNYVSEKVDINFPGTNLNKYKTLKAKIIS